MRQILATIVGFGFVAVVAQRPDLGILFTAVALPATQTYDSGIPGFSPFNFLIFGLVVGLYLRPKAAEGPPMKFPARVPMAAFCVTVLYGWLVGYFARNIPVVEGVEPYSRLEAFMSMKETWCLCLLMLLAFWSARTVEEVKRNLQLVALGMSAEVVFSILDWLRRMGRITGHLQRPNSFAAFMALVAVTMAGLFMTTRTRRRWAFFALGGTAGFCCLMSHSRGGTLALFLGVGILALLRNRLLLIVLVVMGLTYRMWLPDVLLQRFDHAYVENDEGNVEAADTVAQRFTIWKAGWGIMQDHPYGSGLRTYARYSAQYGTAGTMHHPDKDAHNEYVRIAVELSVPSLLIFLWFLSSLAITTFHCYVTGKDLGLSHVGFTGFAALLGISIPCMVGTFFFQANISGHFWLILGLACRADCLVRAHASGGAQDVGAWAA